MKILFVHDGPFYYMDNNYYTVGTLDYKNWERYLKVFDSITVGSRVIYPNEELAPKKVKLSSRDCVDFFQLPNVSNIKGKLFSQSNLNYILTEKIQEVDGLIIRLPSELGKKAAMLAQKLDKPYLIEVVGDAHDAYWYHGSISGKVYAKINSFSVKGIMKKSLFSIYVTKEYLQGRYPSSRKGLQINCSNVHINVPSKEILNIRDKNINNLKEKVEVNLGLIGSLNSKYKGIDTAIETVKYINNIEKNRSFNLHILGYGSMDYWTKFAKENNVENRVTFHPPLSDQKDVLKWLDKIDMYIHPSKTEGLPRALIEAMSRGCPSVASNVGGIPELLKREYLHNPSDYRAMGDIIVDMFNTPKKMLVASRENYIKSLEYDYSVLEEKRTNFLREYKKYIIENKAGN